MLTGGASSYGSTLGNNETNILRDDNNNSTKTNKTKYALLCLFVFAAICLILPYSTKMVSIPEGKASVDSKPTNHALFAHKDEREEIVLDFYDMDETKRIANLPIGSDEWIKTHNALIDDYGYDPNDRSVRYTFRVYEDEYSASLFAQEVESDGFFQKFRNQQKKKQQKARQAAKGKTKKKKAPTPAPTVDPVSIGNMRCYSKYTYDNEGENGGSNGYYNIMDCGKHVLTGCFSYSTAEFVSGELAEDDMATGIKGCRSFALDGKQANNGNGDYVGIGARCCVPLLEGAVLTTAVTVVDPVENSRYETTYDPYGLCMDVTIEDFKKYTRDDYQLMGCSGWTGIDMPYGQPGDLGYSTTTMTKQMIGTRIIDNTQFNAGHCSSHRGDLVGFISAGAIGGRVSTGKLDCVIVESKNAKDDAGMFKSTANCPAGFQNVDCNAYLENYMDQCQSPISGDMRSYGGKYNIEHGCDAYGNTNAIRAQASCCRIVNGRM